ncbi:MAG: DUF3016 domain-containing protein [Opitutaceae bacterium]
MKPLLRPLLVAFCLLSLPATPVLRAGPEPANAPKVKLTFVDWEKFTDIVVDGTTTKAGSDVIWSELNRHLSTLVRQALEPGQTLVINMRDVDLAGVVEPWRGPDFGHVRYIRDTAPPRLLFDFQVLDAGGAVVKEGSERLTDLAFRFQQPPIGRNDTTYYEKQLLTDWVRSTFASPRKAKRKAD